MTIPKTTNYNASAKSFLPLKVMPLPLEQRWPWFILQPTSFRVGESNSLKPRHFWRLEPWISLILNFGFGGCMWKTILLASSKSNTEASDSRRNWKGQSKPLLARSRLLELRYQALVAAVITLVFVAIIASLALAHEWSGTILRYVILSMIIVAVASGYVMRYYGLRRSSVERWRTPRCWKWNVHLDGLWPPCWNILSLTHSRCQSA